MACVPSGCKCSAIHFIILEVIRDQCIAFDLIKKFKIEVLAAGIEVDFIFTGQLDY